MSTQKTLKSEIYHQLFQDIMENKLASGNVITEKILVERFGVSKSPVREALIELCNEGILRSIPRYGYEVVLLTERDVREIKEYRILLECGVVNRYWDEIATPEHTEYLRKLWEKDREMGNQQNALEHWNRNTKFHLALIEPCRNQYLQDNLKQALRVMARAYAQFFWDKWQRTVFSSTADQHRLITESFQRNDKEMALHHIEEDIKDLQRDSML